MAVGCLRRGAGLHAALGGVSEGPAGECVLVWRALSRSFRPATALSQQKSLRFLLRYFFTPLLKIMITMATMATKPLTRNGGADRLPGYMLNAFT